MLRPFSSRERGLFVSVDGPPYGLILRRRATLRGAVAGQAQPARRSRAAKDASSHHDEVKSYFWYAHYPRHP